MQEKNPGIMIRCSARRPCVLCGNTGYCMVMDYGGGNQVHWCAKAATEGDVVARDGRVYSYICTKDPSTNPDLIGTFKLYQEREVKEYLRAKWKAEHTGRVAGQLPKGSKEAAMPPLPVALSENVLGGEDVDPPLSNKELDARYRYFLSLLVLEGFHREILLKDWNTAVYPNMGDRLLKEYPIRSLPPEDRVRCGDKYPHKLQNPFRKHIIRMMWEKFGTLTGIPGFYERSGKYWEEKPVSERWTFVPQEGIIFPVYDKDGYLYRIRVREDFPVMKVKPEMGYRGGQEGALSHGYGSDGSHVWAWYPKTESEIRSSAEVVYGEGAKEPISLDDRFLPMVGKPDGKYKNFSSCRVVRKGTEAVNQYLHGCKSGSPYSLYVPQNCSGYTVVIGTEGEKKAMVAAEAKGIPSVSIPGVSCYNEMFALKGGEEHSLISMLQQKGMKIFILCYDADKKDNRQVAAAEMECLKKLRAAGVTPYIGEWSGRFDKGLDDILLMGLDFKLCDPFCQG